MDEKKLNQALYKKMSAEQDTYRNQLLTQSPKDILAQAHEYALREDILAEMDILDLPKEQAAALLEASTPLADVYQDLRNRDGHMDNVRSCIEDLAEGLLKTQREAAIRSTPFYQHSGAYAREHGELDAYRASRKANIACKDAIETEIRDKYVEGYLRADAKGLLAAFGPERVSCVLAATLREKTYDERFSGHNQAWAATILMIDPPDRCDDYRINSHSVLLDTFVDMVRGELDAMREQKSKAEKRPSVKKQLTAKPVSSDQPSKSVKPKDRGAR